MTQIGLIVVASYVIILHNAYFIIIIIIISLHVPCFTIHMCLVQLSKVQLTQNGRHKQSHANSVVVSLQVSPYSVEAALCHYLEMNQVGILTIRPELDKPDTA